MLRERTKCRALAEELENPLNIHRWRKLEGSDPASFELIQKVQALQRRLIEKTEEIVKKEMLIQEKEKMYIELREILARQPGPEVTEQLSEFQRALRAKTKQLKRIAAELNMSEAGQQEQDMEIHRLARELQVSSTPLTHRLPSLQKSAVILAFGHLLLCNRVRVKITSLYLVRMLNKSIFLPKSEKFLDAKKTSKRTSNSALRRSLKTVPSSRAAASI